jgi:3-dehydroquinate synthase
MRPLAAKERRGRFDVVARALSGPVIAVCDAKVLRLHPHVGWALARKAARVVPLRAGERAKTLRTLERVTGACLDVPRGATVLAVGGGTIGDLTTVFAHTFKRGVARFVQVPTTSLAAVDSSVGGKGAVNVGAAKNALGVFHFADEAWLCPELFETLTVAQVREGLLEAWKMAVTLDASTWARWKASPPSLDEAIAVGRRLKARLVAKDAFETRGLRVALNFGHTFGHVIESVSRFRVRHGEAVGLGMRVALDVGVRLGVTPRAVAAEVESALPDGPDARARLERWLGAVPVEELGRLLAADKKCVGGQGVAMVLLERPGRWRLVEVPWRVLRRQRWGAGVQGASEAS